MATTTARRPAIRLTATMTLTAAMALTAIALGFTLPGQPHPGAAITLTLPAIITIMALSELAAIDRRIGDHNHTLSLSEVGLVIGLAFAAPVPLIAGRVIAGLIVYGAIRRIQPLKLAFNTALFAVETTIAAAVFHTLTGTTPIHDPSAWVALTLAMATATVIGLGAVRTILAIHHADQPRSIIIFSLAITAAATTIGTIGVVALTLHTEAAILILALSTTALLAMRTINTLTQRLTPTT